MESNEGDAISKHNSQKTSRGIEQMTEVRHIRMLCVTESKKRLPKLFNI